jgi:alpha-1,3-rhamnosyltransferase
MSRSSLHSENGFKKTEYPLVSVVVPAFNHENYIDECLLSILDQDYPHIDLIVINDGSTDKTDLRIRNIHNQDPSRFRYISKNNEGLIKTLNMGLRLARGEYFCELASDDLMLPDSIMKRVLYLQKHPEIDAVFADALIIEGNKKTDIKLCAGNVKYCSSEHTIQDFIRGKTKILFPSGLIKKAILEKLGGFDENLRFFEDVSIWYQLILSAKIGSLDEPVMYYRKHSSNTSTSYRFRVRKEKILALEKLCQHDLPGLQGLLRENLYREYIRFIKSSLKNAVDREELNHIYNKAITEYPHHLKLRYYMMLSRIKRIS